jgi:hypothetical protein
MKKWGVSSIALVLLLSAAAVAQEAAKTESAKPQGASRKTISITGKMSKDGRVLLRDADSEVWTVSNPEALQGYAGREVVIRCQVVPDKNELRVVSVKPVKGETAYAKWGDSAFRR